MEMVLCMRQIDANYKQLLCKQTMQRVPCGYSGGFVMSCHLCKLYDTEEYCECDREIGEEE